jgi:hypothetical protein
MASFESYVAQAKKNIEFFENIHDRNNFLDWQVTTTYYIAVHLINAHLFKHNGCIYNSHEKVKMYINPHALVKGDWTLDDETYNSYVSLENLSRKSRYLTKVEIKNDNNVYYTKFKDLIKAIDLLDKIMKYFNDKMGIDFDEIHLKIFQSELKRELKFFKPLIVPATV